MKTSPSTRRADARWRRCRIKLAQSSQREQGPSCARQADAPWSETVAAERQPNSRRERRGREQRTRGASCAHPVRDSEAQHCSAQQARTKPELPERSSRRLPPFARGYAEQVSRQHHRTHQYRPTEGRSQISKLPGARTVEDKAQHPQDSHRYTKREIARRARALNNARLCSFTSL